MSEHSSSGQTGTSTSASTVITQNTAGGAVIAGAVLFALKRSGGLRTMQAAMER